MSGENWVWWFWVSGSSIVAAACGIIAWWRGGAPERYGFTLILIGWTLTPFVQDRGGHGPGVWVMLLDIITFAGLIVISVWSRRIWTLFAGAFMLDTVASHLVVFLAPHVDLYSYITSLGLWSGYALALSMVAGVWENEIYRKARASLSQEAHQKL
ncbi:hypothetical protein Q1W73_04870 [Asticcacaulis sp. ZE23SCel15]|uniref:hypothetical protein n=1 Tax=Asticcacaulis sp. ZE23SCel15 TaxID=3059027 RepID=UPI00265E3759|nr:hypothetical protein [Asticcacaulis sp. ZE23SCel15]WKL58316.1 hypothetical protein Q1W73_04870 [Asticcacaulis sp. ZE23SCel15]